MIRGVLLDVGGIFVLPASEVVGAALDAASLAHNSCFAEAHFAGVAAVDNADRPDAGLSTYLRGYVTTLSTTDVTAAIAAVEPLWHRSSVDLWRDVVDGSIEGIRALADRDLRLGIISNSDGTVAEQLRVSGVCQVGPGAAVPVLTILDSAIVGIAKPDPRIFAMGVDALGLDPTEVAYVGDSVRYDVNPASSFGLQAFHFDPLGACRNGEHRHLSKLDHLFAAL